MKGLEEDINTFWQIEGLEEFCCLSAYDTDIWGTDDLTVDDIERLENERPVKFNLNDIICEYAKSNRSKCKVCKVFHPQKPSGKVRALQNTKA